MARLSDKLVRTLPGPIGGKADCVHWDGDLMGFGLRILKSGSRSWLVRYRIGGKQRSRTLGSTAELRAVEAREEARRILAAAHAGHDEKVLVQERKRAAAAPPALTFGKLVERVLADLRASRRTTSYQEAERYLSRDAAELHPLPVEAVTRRHIADLLDRKARRGKVAANRLRSALSRAFSWGMERGLADANPVVGTGRHTELSSERVLATAELREVWGATGAGSDADRIIRLLMLTGARRGEVSGMCWSEIDTEGAMWRVPGARTKNRREHLVPLSATALAVIDGLHGEAGRDTLFGRGGASRPFHGGQLKARLDDRIARRRYHASAQGRKVQGSPSPEELAAYVLPAWTIHDLRRTVATGMAELGVQPHVIEAVINHVSGHKGGVAGIYNRASYEKEKREALCRWAAELMAIVGEAPRKVVPLRAANASASGAA